MAPETFSGEKTVACYGKTDVFFPKHHNANTINAARDICRVCPAYEACVDRWLHNYDDVPKGILFGYTEIERQQMDGGNLEYRDWREDPPLISKGTLAALERQALRRKVPAVVDIYRLYEVEDVSEREAIIDAYYDWCRSQQYPGSREDALERIEHLARVAAGAKDKGGRALRVPVKYRPECPNGHEKKDMTRNQGGNQWVCYVCRAKVYADPADLIPSELQRSA